jgi:predicted chitinase
MDAKKFFDEIKASLFEHGITQVQVDSINAIFASCAKHGITMPEQIAYVFATAYHEARLKPIEEVGKGAGHDYGKHLKMSRAPYTTPNQLYYGRGFCQITWYENYETFGKLLGVDLLNHPELAMSPQYASEIIVMGMQKGMFTGKMLVTYFNSQIKDPINARKIINGMDKAQLIAGYYGIFLHALT